MNRKKIVVGVTGGNGFIGRHIVERLKNEGFDVISLQRARTHTSQFEIRTFDLCKLESINDKLLKGIDILIHTAALVHKTKLNNMSYQVMNIKATEKFYKLSVDLGIKKFIFLSSVSVYGKSSFPSPINIKFPTSPITEYGKSKLKSENYLLNCMEKISSGPKISIFRLPLVIGKGAPGNYGLLEKLSKFDFSLPFGSANNQRTFITIQMLVDILIEGCMNIERHQGISLLGSNKPLSTREIIYILKEENGLEPKLISIPKPVMKFCLSVFGKSKIYEQLFEDLIFISSIRGNEKN